MFGLAGCLIPILIHLYNRRKTSTIKWAAMSFLVKAWNQEKKKTRIHNYILLALRCLIPLVMGFILAGPQ